MPPIRRWTARLLELEASRPPSYERRCRKPHVIYRLAADEIRFGIRFPVSPEQFAEIIEETKKSEAKGA
jgi:hypothetical protein